MIIKAISREAVAVSSAVVTLTEATVKSALNGRMRHIYCEIDVQDDDVYVTYQGTDPSATVGEKWYAKDKKRVWGVDNMTALKFLRVTGDAVLEVTYWGN